MGVATGAAVITTNVDIPNDIESVDAMLFVVANAPIVQPQLSVPMGLAFRR